MVGPDPIELAVLVVLNLLIDDVLDLHRVPDVLDRLSSTLTSRFERQAPAPNHALEHSLMEEDRVDSVQGDLDATLGEYPSSEDAAVSGDHEMLGDQADPLNDEVDECGDDRSSDDHPEHRPGLAHRTPPQRHPQTEKDRHYEGNDAAEQGYRMGMKVEHELFGVVQL